jgi:hypothetical protein
MATTGVITQNPVKVGLLFVAFPRPEPAIIAEIKNPPDEKAQNETPTEASSAIPSAPLARLSKIRTIPATAAIALTIPRSIRFQIPILGWLKSDGSDGIKGTGCRSVAPQFLQNKEPVSVEPHFGQTEP